MAWTRTYTDEQLIAAIDSSRSWRGVLSELGLATSSAKAIRSVRSHADRLGLDHAHFVGQRRRVDEQLRASVAAAHSWSEVIDSLGLGGGTALALTRGHAARLGLDVTHLTASPIEDGYAGEPSLDYLNRAGSLLAAAWFLLCGQSISWPLEPSRYDLLVDTGARVRHVQVKTTTVRAGGTWKVYLSTSGRERKTYDPEEIDDFFLIDGEFNYYLIPASVVGGLQAIHLGSYERYRLSQATSPRGTPRTHVEMR